MEPNDQETVAQLSGEAYRTALLSLADDLPRLMKEGNVFLVALIMSLAKELRRSPVAPLPPAPTSH